MTIALNNTDVIEGGASVASVVDFTISGIVGTTITRLASGTLTTTLTTALYTAGAAVGVSSIVLVNTHSAAVDVTLRLDPADGGNPRYLIPETVSLGIGYSLHTNGTSFATFDASGNVQTLPGLHSALHKAGGADELLNDPGAIGGDTPAAGAFTTLSASGLITATGGQIAFPATAVPSADPNTLDDYEEGYHTATVTCATSGNYTLGDDTLAYTKTGRVVHVQGKLLVTGENAPSGLLRVSLPFTAAVLTESSDVTHGTCNIQNHGDAGIENSFGIIVDSLAYFSIQNLTDTGSVEVVDESRVDTAFNLFVNITYIAA